MTHNALRKFFAPLAAWLLIAAILAAPGLAVAQDADSAAPSATGLDGYTPWPTDIVELFERLPVQDEGRVKPFDTFAQFRMLRMHSKRTMRLPVKDGGTTETVKIGPTEWLLDVLFRSERAQKYPTFTIDDSRVVVALGLEPHAKKRDRYSYLELLPGRAKLSELGMEYAKIEAEERTLEQGMLVNLARNVSDFEFLNNQFSFARKGIAVDGEGLPSEIFGETKGTLEVAELISKTEKLREFLAGDRGNLTPAVEMMMRQLEFYLGSARGLDLFPPRPGAGEKWLSAGEIMEASFLDPETRAWGLERLNLIKALVTSVDDEEKFRSAATAFSDRIESDVPDGVDPGKVGMEVSFYKGKFFYRALMLFVLGFIFIAFSWLAPVSRFGKWMATGAIVSAVLGLVSLVAGVVMRCLIQNRPPIHNLYDTILFITGVAVLVALFIEYANRQRLGLAAAVVLGAAGMFLAMRFEIKHANDTMESVRAVLDSNFWLSTHVTTINIGYSAGLLAAGLAHFYFLARLFGARKGDKQFYRNATRMTYGVICFALFFALVGTVLGGIWANYSWGRFWGWDPKENGAFMIVLWFLVILHARMGGYIRDLGVNAFAIIGGVIVSFSWWGVNQLGVGLHAYGFTEGVWPALFSFWAFELAMLAIPVFLWLRAREKPGDKVEGKGAPA